jgi:hypothetical protein
LPERANDTNIQEQLAGITQDKEFMKINFKTTAIKLLKTCQFELSPLGQDYRRQCPAPIQFPGAAITSATISGVIINLLPFVS